VGRGGEGDRREPGQDGADAMVDTARYLLGVDAAVEGDDLVGQAGIGQDRCGEVGDLGRPADRHLPGQLCRGAGQYPGLVDQRRRQRVDRDPGGGERAAERSRSALTCAALRPR